MGNQIVVLVEFVYAVVAVNGNQDEGPDKG